jgi:hypothetical protein
MSNEVSVQQSSTQIAMPSDLAALFGGVKSNVASTDRVNTLRISGKVWKVDMDGEVKKLTTVIEGEEIPVPMVKVIILNQNPKRARALFEGAWDESNSSAPACWSSDSVRPDSDVQHPKAASCEQCPEAQKKTKFDDNNPDKVIEFVPCKFNKRIAVVQHNRPDSPALRCGLAISSLWEPKDTAKAKEAQGWFAFDQYCRHIASKGVPHTAMCRTIMKFDPDTNHSKILFKFDGLIDAETASKIVPRLESEEVMKCLGLFKKPGDAQAVVEVDQPKPIAPAPVQEVPVEEKAAEVVVEKPAKVTKPKAEKKEPVQVVEADSLDEALSLAWD